MKIDLKKLCILAFVSIQANAAEYELYCPQTVTVKNINNVVYSWDSTDNYKIWLDKNKIYWDGGASKPVVGGTLTYSFFYADSSFTGTKGYSCSYRLGESDNRNQLSLLLNNRDNIVKISDVNKENWTEAPSGKDWYRCINFPANQCQMTLMTQN